MNLDFFFQFQDVVSASRLLHRGPDHVKYSTHALGKFNGHFCGCTLHFRGSITSQPLAAANGDLLLWNGEIFGGLGVFMIYK